MRLPGIGPGWTLLRVVFGLPVALGCFFALRWLGMTDRHWMVAIIAIVTIVIANGCAYIVMKRRR